MHFDDYRASATIFNMDKHGKLTPSLLLIGMHNHVLNVI